ncbi:MAG: DNA-protecting protein DprA [Deltaproteobacteria bacterium]|nr:DNA-protecting protein DprA [Deltaproteobacteria bacterium]MBW2016601.1 DNA-protecting protein DprA [Deltaproteobacteria bacterium]MBW2130634.1 DNA-protecting protein DprA [Deltaproteobacteria bacterium]MBW2303134.1 DNA-protecting protein DprA [Deltaproteobacteria bacterium]
MPEKKNTTASWISLSLIPGLGNIAFKNLLEAFGSPENVFRARLKDLLSVKGVREVVARAVFKKEFVQDPVRLLRKIEDMKIHPIIFSDPEYPPLLRTIHDPPMILYRKGRDIPTNVNFLAVVGSRHPTQYGIKTAEMIAYGLARRGLGIASGMAQGIDAAGHWGCMKGGNFTVAVLGTGHDVVYPASNRRLFSIICEKGAVISEFPPGTPPDPKNFPIRNRIISGISKGVLVVEATRKSGSLITAALALEQGREVFAVPGSIHSFKSAGCHLLLKQGAALVENAQDILQGLGLHFSGLQEMKGEKAPKNGIQEIEEGERIVFDVLGDFPVHIDQIAKQTGMLPAEVSSLLLQLELKGIIRQLPGKMFVRQ